MSNRNRKRNNKNKQTKPVVQLFGENNGEDDSKMLEGFRYIESKPKHTEPSESEPDEAFEVEPEDEVVQDAAHEEPEDAEIEPEEIAEGVTSETEPEEKSEEATAETEPEGTSEEAVAETESEAASKEIAEEEPEVALVEASEAKSDEKPEKKDESEPRGDLLAITEAEPEEVSELEEEDPVDELPSGRKTKPRKKPVKEVEIIRAEPETKEKSRARHGNKYNILFVSESTKRVKTIRTTSDKILLLTILFAGLIAAIVAYIVHQSTVKEEYEEKIESLNEEISTLSEDKILLQADIEALDQELQDANDKLSKKENLAQAQNEEQALLYMPSALPLDSQALPSEYDKDNKWITLDAAPGVHIVATGAGKVEYSGESIEAGGYLVSVDHGNGYVSNYYCQNQPAVKEGNEVNRGTTLYVIGDEADKLIYRIQYEGDYIDPYTVLNIAG